MKSTLASELLALSVAERIQLVEDLWDSVAAEPEQVPPPSDAEFREIERRLAAYDADPSIASEWSEVRARLWSRLG